MAPYTVLIDPVEFIRNMRPDRPVLESVRYIYGKQIEEADLLVLNKVNRLAKAAIKKITSLLEKEFPGIPLMSMSAATGAGVETWLDTVLASQKSGRRIAEVDYDTYAGGEAALGWLNAAVRLHASASVAPCRTRTTSTRTR